MSNISNIQFTLPYHPDRGFSYILSQAINDGHFGDPMPTHLTDVLPLFSNDVIKAVLESTSGGCEAGVIPETADSVAGDLGVPSCTMLVRWKPGTEVVVYW